jgi:hypothetical protein
VSIETKENSCHISWTYDKGILSGSHQLMVYQCVYVFTYLQILVGVFEFASSVKVCSTCNFCSCAHHLSQHMRSVTVYTFAQTKHTCGQQLVGYYIDYIIFDCMFLIFDEFRRAALCGTAASLAVILVRHAHPENTVGYTSSCDDSVGCMQLVFVTGDAFLREGNAKE